MANVRQAVHVEKEGKIMVDRSTAGKLTAEVIQQRTQSNAADRPLLDGEASLDRIEALLQDRAPFYAQAEYTIDTSNQSHQQVVDAIIKQVDGLSADSERVS